MPGRMAKIWSRPGEAAKPVVRNSSPSVALVWTSGSKRVPIWNISMPQASQVTSASAEIGRQHNRAGTDEPACADSCGDRGEQDDGHRLPGRTRVGLDAFVDGGVEHRGARQPVKEDARRCLRRPERGWSWLTLLANGHQESEQDGCQPAS